MPFLIKLGQNKALLKFLSGFWNIQEKKKTYFMFQRTRKMLRVEWH